MVAGSLSALGSASTPIIITSINDDTQGGDSNPGAGAVSVGACGGGATNCDWKRILFKTGSNSTLEHWSVQYGGFGSVGAFTLETGATVATSSITFSNNLVNTQGP